MPVILDGPMGTELLARGIPTPEPAWSAHALLLAPDVVGDVHADYLRAGASVHTANTFRTRRRTFPAQWQLLTRQAVALARHRVGGPGRRVAGSISPLEDCYRPDLSPEDPRPEHKEMARLLAGCGCDVLLCETFPHVGEALVAVEEAVATGVETWVSFTAGPYADLLSPQQVRDGAREAVNRGAAAVLVNCIPASRILPYVDAIADLGVPFGVYANAGSPDEGMGWRRQTEIPGAPERYAEHAARWVERGASLLGSCCGTGPAVIAELHRRFGPSPAERLARPRKVAT